MYSFNHKQYYYQYNNNNVVKMFIVGDNSNNKTNCNVMLYPCDIGHSGPLNP